MTVVAAAFTDDGVVMAADAQVSTGGFKGTHDVPKVWVSDKYAFGACGSHRVAQVARHHVSWPKFRPDEDTDFEAFVVKSVVPAIRSAVRDNGSLHTDNGVEWVDMTLLATVADRIVEIDAYSAAVIDPLRRAAVGSGYAEALGHLGDTGPWTEADVIEATRRATVSARGCSGPISVVNGRTLTVKTLGDAS